MVKWLSSFYAALLYAFIFLPVAVLVLFSFQSTMFPIPPLNGLSLRWYSAVLNDTRLTSALVNSIAVAITTSAVSATAVADAKARPPALRKRARAAATGSKPTTL